MYSENDLIEPIALKKLLFMDEIYIHILLLIMCEVKGSEYQRCSQTL